MALSKKLQSVQYLPPPPPRRANVLFAVRILVQKFFSIVKIAWGKGGKGGGVVILLLSADSSQQLLTIVSVSHVAKYLQNNSARHKALTCVSCHSSYHWTIFLQAEDAQ
jgi:hypothetical protein